MRPAVGTAAPAHGHGGFGRRQFGHHGAYRLAAFGRLLNDCCGEDLLGSGVIPVAEGIGPGCVLACCRPLGNTFLKRVRTQSADCKHKLRAEGVPEKHKHLMVGYE